jgi:hypothetical protein
MALIIVGGQAKDIGKTTLVCSIIAHFSDRRWTAVKFSTHLHEPVSAERIVHTNDVTIWEQRDPGEATDTARFLQAGAGRALLVTSRLATPEAEWNLVLAQLSPDTHLIAECTRVPERVKPDLFFMVVDPEIPDFKDSARNAIGGAHAVVHRGKLDDGTKALVAGVLNLG